MALIQRLMFCLTLTPAPTNSNRTRNPWQSLESTEVNFSTSSHRLPAEVGVVEVDPIKVSSQLNIYTLDSLVHGEFGSADFQICRLTAHTAPPNAAIRCFPHSSQILRSGLDCQPTSLHMMLSLKSSTIVLGLVLWIHYCGTAV